MGIREDDSSRGSLGNSLMRAWLGRGLSTARGHVTCKMLSMEERARARRGRTDRHEAPALGSHRISETKQHPVQNECKQLFPETYVGDL